ncbi:hypothetical protein [Rhodococcus sp. IEGM 1379]|uniref:hypothetical protein n=1 Tax=Rhodococcus sp. IEGM 1379 TaxID=3047086 RepID=UPI0024B7253D|nr:hypothetical protein [Rhodococcus sp. IEGM 1379]MDI9914218.1 hypothetical protein [Rhodococcus sp. IEGM 1379]
MSILLNNPVAMETNALGLSQKKFGTMNISGDYTAMARSLGAYAERSDSRVRGSPFTVS